MSPAQVHTAGEWWWREGGCVDGAEGAWLMHPTGLSVRAGNDGA